LEKREEVEVEKLDLEELEIFMTNCEEIGKNHPKMTP